MNEHQPPEPAAESTTGAISAEPREGAPREGEPHGAAGRSGAQRTRHRSAGYAVVLLSLTALVYVFDQLTKWWVVATMTEGRVTPVLPPLLNWRFIRNPGAAFSIGVDHTWIFTIIMVVVSAFIFLQIRKVASRGWALALGLVLGGALGNLTDRLFREPSFGQGHVVDFIALPNFAIFNIADSGIVSGVVLICILTLRGIGMDGTRASDASAAGQDTAGQDTAGQDTDGR